MCCFGFTRFSPPRVNDFWYTQLRDAPGVTPIHGAYVWVPGGLCGDCSGRLTSRKLASNREVAFLGAKTEQHNENTTYFI